ncbi:MAG: methionine--tRNA ligase [Bacilli bacterium]|nr:methionine--tRNA ligase [Bacilli bacterium]
MEKEKFYIATAIAYTSAKPHLGNTYEIVLADAIARYKRLTGYDVYFQTGTDEHGQKIEGKAASVNKDPQEFVDEMSLEIRRIWDSMNTSYDRFVRTTNPGHEKVVAKVFKKLYDQGDIYKGYYEGLYCTPCESFFTDSQLIDGKCPDCGRDVHQEKEEAYFFKLSNYTEKLEKYLDEHPDFIEPISRKNEIVNNFIKPGVQDLCVSRTTFNWGIPVDFDLKHVVYVWLDALLNYITFLGYDIDSQSEEFKKYWPCDLHLIGKDILRFHTIYWPIILMALDLPLPKKIFGHPWLLFGNDKMSKSKGNIVYADDLASIFGVDAVRYYLLHEIPFANDGNYTNELLIDCYNSDLANVLGNLVNRTISMCHKYFDGEVMEANCPEAVDKELIDLVLKTNEIVEEKMNGYRIAEAIDAIFEIFKRSNKYIDETTPWLLAKDETKKDRLATVLYNLLESIRHGAVLLGAFLPDTSKEIFHQLNTENNQYDSIKDFTGMDIGIHLNNPHPLFDRIDKEKTLDELSTK